MERRLALAAALLPLALLSARPSAAATATAYGYGYDISAWVKAYTRASVWGNVAGSTFWSTDQFVYNGALAVYYGSVVLLCGRYFSEAYVKLSFPVNASAWTHVVGTYNASEGAGTAKLYVDGQLRRTRTDAGTTERMEEHFFIGRQFDVNAGMNDLRLSGQVDEVGVWSVVLDEAQVQRLYTGGPMTGREPGLLLAYSADHDNQTHAIDLSPNARHGALRGLQLANADEVAPYAVVARRPNCLWARDAALAGRYLQPNETTCTPGATSAVCGDGAVTGAEQCEVGAHCSNCRCGEGYEPLDLACVSAANASACTYDRLAAVTAAFATSASCAGIEGLATTSVAALGCTGYEIPIAQFVTLGKKCVALCGKIDGCLASLREQRVLLAASGEVCDNGVLDPEYGCGRCTAVTPGWKCSPGSCETVCGDGILAGAEACDPPVGVRGCADDCSGALPGYVCERVPDNATAAYTSHCACRSPSCRGSRSPLSGGAIAGIAVAGFVLIVAPIAASVVLIAFVLNRRQEQECLMRPMEVGLSAVFATEGKKLQSFDYTKSRYIDPSEFPFELSTLKLTFGDELAPIRTQLCSELVITSHHIGGHWQLYADPAETYSLSFSPDHGFLSKRSEVAVAGQIVINCTTTVAAKVGLVMSSKPLSDETELKHTFIDVNVQSKLSTFLDPEEIRLITPSIGEGSFGTVYKGSYRTQDVAVKVMKFQDMGSRRAEFEHEIAIMEGLRCPFIVGFVGAVMIPGKLCLVTEYVPLGSLGSAIRRGNMSYVFKLRASYDCARGMNYLHKSRILHRDLKPDNLLVASFEVSATAVVKLTDFGTTREVGEAAQQNFTKGIGTPIYMAPEILDCDSEMKYNFPADVYSFAILIYELYTEQEPYSKMNFKHAWDICNFVVNKNRLPIPEDCPPDFAELISACWDHTPERRPDFSRVAETLARMLQGKVDLVFSCGSPPMSPTSRTAPNLGESLKAAAGDEHQHMTAPGEHAAIM
eukprot:m51a1_g7009 putative protein kinase domain containing protein (994) ;mRNA; f:242612-247283